MTAGTSERMFAVPEADLGLILDYSARHLLAGDDPQYRDALGRTIEAWRACHEAAFAEMITPAPEPEREPLPEGIFGRVEMPGYREDTGWITEESRFGQQMAVVRDWDGREVALAAIGPGCRVVVLPTPRKRPDPPKALSPAGPRPDWEVDEDDLDDDDEDRF